MNMQQEVEAQFSQAVSVPNTISGKSHKETADNYANVVFRYGRFRVIACHNGIQWILQHNRSAAGAMSGPRWAAIAYCTTRSGLISRWRKEAGFDAPELAEFPEQFQPMDELPAPAPELVT